MTLTAPRCFALALLMFITPTLGWAITSPGDTQSGLASYYGKEFHGRRTASGQRFDMNKLTAAHRKLPIGSRVRVTHHGTGKSIVVTVTDRGPFKKGRVIDLSLAAARSLGMVKAGVSRVSVELLSLPDDS